MSLWINGRHPLAFSISLQLPATSWKILEVGPCSPRHSLPILRERIQTHSHQEVPFIRKQSRICLQIKPRAPCWSCMHTLWSFSISSITCPGSFPITIDSIGSSRTSSHVPSPCPCTLEPCCWLNNSRYKNEWRLPPFRLTPLSQLFSLLFPSLLHGAS